MWLLDVTDKRFPHQFAEDQDEELRLLYVACTRAKVDLVISTVRGNESVFINLIERTNSKILKNIGVKKEASVNVTSP